MSASVRAKDSDVIVTGWQNDDGSYHLYNDEYKISVFDVKGINTVINDAGSINPNFKDYTRNGRNLDTLYSENGEFNDKAIILMDQSVKISSFYKNLGYEGFDQLHVAINDSYDAGNNARGGGWIIDGRKCASILLGTEFNYNTIDVIAHEYTHAVSGLTVGWNGATRENSALNEAYSDIFGVLYENPQDPDWELTHLTARRNFADPQEDGHYKHVSEIPSSEENYYKLSTIVSHTAYLVSNGIDGNNEMKIDATLLSELWYRSLHLLPSNAMFPQCRNAVELSARIMLKNKALSETQYECVVRAFDQTGIIHANFTNIDTVKNEFVLSVLSHQETENVSFNLAIFKKSSFDLFGWKVSYGNTEMIYDKNHTKGNVSLNLEDGVYIIRVTDNYENESQPISVKIVVDGESSTSADEIVIQTDFWDVTTVLINGNDTSDDWNDIPDESEPIQIESFLSKKPFVDNKGEFAISFEYGFDTAEAWNGGMLTNFPQAMNDTFCITGDFDHDGIEDSVCSAVAADDDCTRFNFNVKTKDYIYVTDVCPSYANCDVYAYVIKGENEDYLVRESSAKRIVEPDDDESTEDYYLYETIFVYSIKSKTSISYEFFCNKQADGYKFTTSGWDGSSHIGDLIYQSWENSDSKNQICDSESSAIEYIKAALEKSGLSERVMGNGSTNCEIIPICAVNKMMKSENQGTAILYTNENSKPQTSVDNNDTPEEGYAGNQTAEQLRKSIIGSWGMIGDYTFDTNGICYFGGDRNHPGTYKITENKKLIIDFPWTHNEYTWSELSFDEFHEDHDFNEYFWCITDEGVLRLNGSDYYRDGRIPLN